MQVLSIMAIQKEGNTAGRVAEAKPAESGEVNSQRMRLEETYPDTSVIIFSVPEPQELATELAIRYQTMPSL